MVQVSWDQQASHQVLERWVERALNDENVSGISSSINSVVDGKVMKLRSKKGVKSLREKFVGNALNEIDMLFGRTLGCRISPVLKAYVGKDNHIIRKERRAQHAANKKSKKKAAAVDEKDRGEDAIAMEDMI